MSGTVLFAYILMSIENSHFYDDGMMQKDFFSSERQKILQVKEGHSTKQCINQYIFHYNIPGL